MSLKKLVKVSKAPTGVDVAGVLAARGTRYGPFKGHAGIAQSLKRVMRRSPSWDYLPDDSREALEMIVHKIARVLNEGADVAYPDNFVDIAGYAKLVADRLTEEQSGKPAP